jgi:hypothetical protein
MAGNKTAAARGRAGIGSRLARPRQRQARQIAAAAGSALLLLLTALPRCQGAGWRAGRATFYGDQPEYWSIHRGGWWSRRAPSAWPRRALLLLARPR